MEGTPYWRDSTPVISSSLMKPSFIRHVPTLPPVDFWCSRACLSWSDVIKFSLISISPSRDDIEWGLRGLPHTRQDEKEQNAESGYGPIFARSIESGTKTEPVRWYRCFLRGCGNKS